MRLTWRTRNDYSGRPFWWTLRCYRGSRFPHMDSTSVEVSLIYGLQSPHS